MTICDHKMLGGEWISVKLCNETDTLVECPKCKTLVNADKLLHPIRLNNHIEYKTFIPPKIYIGNKHHNTFHGQLLPIDHRE